jgi:hypothetical protein
MPAPCCLECREPVPALPVSGAEASVVRMLGEIATARSTIARGTIANSGISGVMKKGFRPTREAGDGASSRTLPSQAARNSAMPACTVRRFSGGRLVRAPTARIRQTPATIARAVAKMMKVRYQGIWGIMIVLLHAECLLVNRCWCRRRARRSPGFRAGARSTAPRQCWKQPRPVPFPRAGSRRKAPCFPSA